MKKAIAFIIALSLCPTSLVAFADEVVTSDTPTPYGIAKTFDDVKGEWYEEYVMSAVEIGLLKGSDDGLFHGEDNVTRAELGTILYRLINKTEPKIEEGKLWYADTEAWLTEDGVISAFGWKSFDGDKALTREEVLFMIFNSLHLDAPKTMPTFKDLDKVSDYADGAVSWAAKNNIVVGNEDNCLNPTDNVTRAETATILTRLVKYMDKSLEDDEDDLYKTYDTIDDAEKALGYLVARPSSDNFELESITTYNEADEKNSHIVLYGTLDDEYAITLTQGLGDRDLSNLNAVQNVNEFNDEDYAIAYKTGEYSYAPDQTFVNATWSVTEEDGTIRAYSVTINNADMDTLKDFIKSFGATGDDTLENPMKEYETLDEAANAVGYELVLPDTEDLEILQIFTYNEDDKLNSIVRVDGMLNGNHIEIRQGLGDRDVSGVYVSENAMVGHDDTYSITYSIEDYETLDGKFFMLATWNTTDEDGQIHAYSIYLDQGDVDTIKPLILAIGADEYADDEPIKQAKG